MIAQRVQEGERFEELLPSGRVGALWQVMYAEGPDRRVHLFDVDDPVRIRTVHTDRLLDGNRYRRSMSGRLRAHDEGV